MDKRSALQPGTELHFSGMTCVIGEEIGRGSNAIVYRSWYADAVSVEQRHEVLVKELFPYDEKAAVFREGSEVRWLPEAQPLVALHTQSFLWGNETHLELRRRYPTHMGGNLNSFPLNNTYYTVLDFSGGRSLDRELAQPGGTCSLRRLAQRMMGVLESVQVFHESGFLHLDVSPENILLLDTGRRERVELIDFNSVVRMDSIADGESILASMKTGYASPEMRRHAYAEAGPWTDLYSVAAVFFRCLTGRTLSRMQLSGILPADASGSELLRGVPETVRGMAAHLIAKGLRTIVRDRYQTAEEMLSDFSELIDRIDGVGITHSSLWEAGRRSVQRTLGANPALAYVQSEDALFPVSVLGADGSLRENVLPLRRNALLTGSGGMGKTTLLLRTAWRESRRYSAGRPVVLYISLYGWHEGDANYLHDSILQKLRFKPETGSYDDARHALELLVQRPLSTPRGECPMLCLLLDGYNEISGDSSALVREIRLLTSSAGVGVLIASRTDAPELGFETLRLKPLPPKLVRQLLSSRGLLAPESPQMQELLSNAMMLSLFIRACQGEQQQLTPQTESELIEAYISSLESKEIDKLPENSPEKWQLAAAIRYVYPMAARWESKRGRGLTGVELLKLVGELYRQLGTRTFAALFPQWVGHGKDIRGESESAEEWCSVMVHQLLRQRLGLLVQGERGDCRVVHQEFLEAAQKQGERIHRALARKKRLRQSLLSLLCAALLSAAALLGFGRIPSYDVMKTLDALGYTQLAYTELNRQYTVMTGLLQNPDPETDTFDLESYATLRGFAGARDRLAKNDFCLLVDTHGDGSVADELTQSLSALKQTGQRVPWSTLAFDEAHFMEMAQLPFDRAERYAGYVDSLETVYQKGTAEDYQHYGGLVAKVLDADAHVAAAYDFLVYSLRSRGMAAWENTPEGSGYAGSYNRLDEGQGSCAGVNAFADADWQSAGLEELISALNSAADEAQAAQRALNRDTTCARLERLT